MNGEHADAAWVVAVHETEAEARLEERSSRCATGCRRCRSSRVLGDGGDGSLVGDQALIDRLFPELDTEARGCACSATRA